MGSRDEADFEAMHERTVDRVMAYCLRQVDVAAAQDAVSETYLVAWRRRRDLPADPLPWLLVTANNVIRNQQRSLRRRWALHRQVVPLTELAEPSPEAGIAGRQQLAEALQQLPASEREALLLVAWDGLTPTQAATVLGISPGNLRMRIHRARGRLRELTREGDGDGH